MKSDVGWKMSTGFSDMETTVLCLFAQSCPTPCDPMDCNPPGSSVHGDSLARILEWVDMPSSRRSSQPRNWTQVSHIAGKRQQGSPRILEWVAYPFSRGSYRPRNQTGVSCIADRFITSWATRESPWSQLVTVKRIFGRVMRQSMIEEGATEKDEKH